jgi:hypothetical protein
MGRQVCPICRDDVKIVEKYPYYLCNRCIEEITDRDGNSVVYQFSSFPFGFKARYKHDPAKEYVYDICYIKGEELKVHSDGKTAYYIQPVNYLKFASRPDDPAEGNKSNTIPFDPERRRNRKKQITIEKIIVPAIFVSLLSLIPALEGIFFLKYFKEHWAVRDAIYLLPASASMFYAWRIMQDRIHKFSRASYFKQHSWAFFCFGLASVLAALCLLSTDFSL